MESIETTLPTQKRPRATGQKPGRKGCPDHRENQLPPVRHDHTSCSRFGFQAASYQACTRCCAEPLDQRCQ